eukprot:TRINITY_DN9059_c0_g1_i1.p1 TRINITY_DN9059_c0_g1~~TRINITY_DN9059_c0_g1_i1.p1  ORF type:complete len:698 (-),score=156.38 TRINITY_DN9059_c0_g1_i1:15-2015(-)
MSTQTQGLGIGILGFGKFGQFLAKRFQGPNRCFALSRTSYDIESKELGLRCYTFEQIELFFSEPLDCLIISVSILSFESVVKSLPLEKLKNILVIDVLSVKSHPKKVLQSILPPEVDILCTHPMFGPESGRYGWNDLPFVYERVRISQVDRCNKFLDLFSSQGCRMIEISCEQHDSYAANSQFITHFTGRMLGEQGLRPTPIDTKGFQMLLYLIDVTVKDSFDLFYGLYRYNPHSAETLQNLNKALLAIEHQLHITDEPEVQTKCHLMNPLIAQISPSQTVALHSLSIELKRQGKKVLSLAVGEPDFPPPKPIEDATIEALRLGHTKYTALAGTIELRQSICGYLKQRKGVSYAPEQILVTNGGKQAIYQSMLSTLFPSDEVIIPAPYWVSYPEIVKLCRATPVILPTRSEQSFLIDIGSLENAITPRTKMIVLCNPSNPTGSVYPKQNLEEIANVLRKHKNQRILVLSDEIYERLVFGVEHVCFASIEGMFERTILINGFSKAYSMTGFRLGYLAGPLHIVKAAMNLQGQLTGQANSLAQHAGVVALSLPDEIMDPIVNVMKEKRDLVLSELAKIPNIHCSIPTGAFYVFPKISGYYGFKTQKGATIGNCDDFCKFLLEDFLVAIVPGSAFGDPEGVRLSYATSFEELSLALAGIRNFVGSLSKQ